MIEVRNLSDQVVRIVTVVDVTVAGQKVYAKDPPTRYLFPKEEALCESGPGVSICIHPEVVASHPKET